MAPAFLFHEAEQKQDFRDSVITRELGKPRRFSRSYSSPFMADYGQAIERVGESDGLENSTVSKRQCISLNTGRYDGFFNVSSQVFSISKMSASERKELESRLRGQLEQIQLLQKKIESESGNGVSVKRTPVLGVHQPKRGHGGRFELTLSGGGGGVAMKLCSQLLNRLLQHPYAWVFKEPVDALKLNIPDYYTIIKQPMDLGTIKKKLRMGAYASASDFAVDVRRTFSNAKTYNPPGNDVHSMADAMSVKFESKWKAIESKIAPFDASKASKISEETKKRKASFVPVSEEKVKEEVESTKKNMSVAEKQKLSSRLEACVSMLPVPVIEFLKKNSGHQIDAADDEIEIDIDVLGDDTLFELKRLLDEYFPEAGAMEVIESGLSNSSMHPAKGSEPLGEEEVDIVGNDNDTLQQIKSKCSSSSNSSSDSESPSSGSDSDSSSESELHGVKTSTPLESVKGAVISSEAAFEQEKSDVMNPADGSRSGGGLSGNTEQESASQQGKEGDEGENAPSERQVSPGKLYRAALLRSRFADTILKAREKALLDKAEKGDPEKRQREREELERQQRKERARLQAEARVAEEARRRAEAEAATEAKRQRELEREAARQALLKIEKTVEIDENRRSLMDLEMLRSASAVDLPIFVDEAVQDESQDVSATGCFVQLDGDNPLERLGLYMKVDDDDDDDDEEETDSGPTAAPVDDVEEGEID
ncbi:transcription factor GTE10-like [Wolffia australiana]